MSKPGTVVVKVKLAYADYVELQKFKGASDSAKIVMLCRLGFKSLARSEAQAAANVAKAEAEYDRAHLPWHKRLFTKAAP